MPRAHRACPTPVPCSPGPCRRPRSCATSCATQAHVFRPPGKPNGLALGGLGLAVVLADHNHSAAFALALKQPVIALEDAGHDLRREPRIAEADPLGADADRHGTDDAYRRRCVSVIREPP